MTLLKWKDRISLALKKGKFTREDVSLAVDFNTCAISERLNKIFINNNQAFEYLTPKAGSLGSRFYHHVHSNQVRSALAIYKKIQKLKRLRRRK